MFNAKANKGTVYMVLVLGVLVSAAQAAEKIVLPDLIAPKVAGRKGICLSLGNGDLAVALVQNTEFFILVLAKDESEYAAVQKRLEDLGVYGRRGTVVVGSFQDIPLPNGYANLIVTDSSTTYDLKEVYRVLNPNGVAVIGCPNGDAGKLKEMASQADITGVTTEGNYAIIPGKMPAGSDDWTHCHHGPDNNPVSQDATIRPPFHTQWIGSDRGWMVAAHGRLLTRANVISVPRGNFRGDGKLQGSRMLVKDGLNGTVLWERSLPAVGVWVNDTVMVDDRVYTLEKKSVVVLEAGTGKEIVTFTAPTEGGAEGGRWYRLAVQNNVCCVLADKNGLPRPKGFGCALADLLLAFDTNSGHLLWTYRAEKPVYEDSLALGPKAAFLTSTELGAIAIDLKTGAELWRNAAETVRNGKEFGVEVPTDCLAIYHEGRICLGGGDEANIRVLDANTGQKVYSLGGFPLTKTMFIGNKVYCGGIDTGLTSFDFLTGKKQPKDLKGNGVLNRCQRTAGTQSCVMEVSYFVDLETKQVYGIDVARTSCEQGANFANGLAYLCHKAFYVSDGYLHRGYGCRCQWPMMSMVALTPAGGKEKAEEPVAGAPQCLQQGPAFGAPVGAVAAAEDWPCYRHDPRHSACASQALKLPAGKGWQRQLSGKLTPLSVVGGVVFVASDDGHVWALDPNGEVKWKYLCRLGVTTAPTYWAGRLLVGSDDGYVYCLDAQTGQLTWSFHAAPKERYIWVDGRPTSTWPVKGGVAIDEGTAYFAAGICSHDKVFLYALNALNGQVNWVKEISRFDKSASLGVVGANPFGALAVSKGLVFVPNGGGRPAVFDKKNGDLVWWVGTLTKQWAHSSFLQPPEVNFFWAGGSEILIDDELMVNGGPRLGGSINELCNYTMYYASTGIDYYPSLTEDRSDGTKPNPQPQHPQCGAPFVLGFTTPTVTPTALYSIAPSDKKKPVELVAYNREKLKNLGVPSGSVAREKAASDATLFSTHNIPVDPSSIIVAGSQLLVAGTSEVVVLGESGQKELARFKIGGKAVANGVAVSQGRAYVPTDSGMVICLGTESQAAPATDR